MWNEDMEGVGSWIEASTAADRTTGGGRAPVVGGSKGTVSNGEGVSRFSNIPSHSGHDQLP